MKQKKVKKNQGNKKDSKKRKKQRKGYNIKILSGEIVYRRNTRRGERGRNLIKGGKKEEKTNSRG